MISGKSSVSFSTITEDGPYKEKTKEVFFEKINLIQLHDWRLLMLSD
jgi:hypothetical protein